MPESAERRPEPPLDRFVARLWANARGPLAHARERLLPSGGADLVLPMLDLPLLRYAAPESASGRRFTTGLVLAASDAPSYRDTSGASSVLGVQFRPGGLAAFVRTPIDRLVSAGALDAEDLLGPSVRELRERLQHLPTTSDRLALLERWLLSRLVDAPPVDLVDRAIATLGREGGETRIDSLVAASGLSGSAFLEKFRRRVGLTPKRFARLVRFRRVVDSLATRGGAPPRLARLALETGYSDQAHLTREFRAFAGLAPTEYAPMLGQPTHVPLRTGNSFKTLGAPPR